MARIFLFIGSIFIFLGLMWLMFEKYHHIKWLHWIGNLPGDIKIEKENFKLYFPITTMLLISIIISIILHLIKRFF